MKRGAWHQCGDKSQRIVVEQLKLGAGVGVVISPRDLTLDNARAYAEEYRALGAEVLLDQQFYVPNFSNSKLTTYPLDRFRGSISSLNRIGDHDLDALSVALETVSRNLGVTAIVAPAVVYQAARADIASMNARLFAAAKRAGDAIGIPTFGSVVLGHSLTGSAQTLVPALSQITALAADGWYFSFEFAAERIPSDRAAVERAGTALLSLACTGKPVLHAFAGPMSLLSFGFGAAGAAIGHSQNTWRFTPERWQPSVEGGGGASPARFFSTGLWGTIVYPDETSRLPASLERSVLTHSPFSAPVAQNPPTSWSKWDANKHLVHLLCRSADRIALLDNARAAAAAAVSVLEAAVVAHGKIAGAGLQLTDSSNAYQANWLAAVRATLSAARNDYDFLEMIG